MTSRQALLTFTSLMLAGCAATDPGTGSTRGEVITVDYGTVMQVEQVQMDPKYGTGALVGGGLGLAAASRRSGTTQAGAAIAGALIGAMIQKSKAGTADKYTVRLNNGGTIQIVTEHHDIKSGDCVSVEQGKHANIRRVSPIMCGSPQSHPDYQEMHEANVEESEECLATKQALLAATTEQEADLAYKKMRAFCEH
jgi:outer membrane lipoprotein SlyB